MPAHGRSPKFRIHGEQVMTNLLHAVDKVTAPRRRSLAGNPGQRRWSVHIRQSGHDRTATDGRPAANAGHSLHPGATGSFGGVAMADGYAQAARRPAFLNLHTAGGLGHGMGNLINSFVAQTPLVVTAGQQDSRHTVTDPLLFGDLVRIAEPTVKWAKEVEQRRSVARPRPARFPRCQRRARR